MRTNKKGFTLLEIIIVIIILAILATLALPRLFENLENSRVSKAVSGLSALRQEMERCGLKREGAYNHADCGFTTLAANIDLVDTASDDWNYNGAATSATAYSFEAQRDGGQQNGTIVAIDQDGNISGGTGTAHPGVADYAIDTN